MFISKKKLQEKIEEATFKVREEDWRLENERRITENMDRMRAEFNKRITTLEKKAGIYEEKHECPYCTPQRPSC